MKLSFNKQNKNSHSNIVYQVLFSNNNSLYSFSDDKTSLNWDLNAENTGKFTDLDVYYTCASWSTSLKSGTELLALGSDCGQIKLINKQGKTEKILQNAHSGSIICIQWSPDGSTIATGGDDGQLKTWSKQVEMRNHLVKGNSPIYALKWNNDSSLLVYASENYLNIEPVLKGGMKTQKWKAHDELILSVDWNLANKLIISGGEDRKYKIWDQYGRNLYVSYPLNSVITSLSWASNGEYFAVGSYNSVRLCNQSGWTYSISKLESGGVMSLDWSSDSTLLSVGGVSIIFN